MRANQAIKIERPNLSILQSLNQESFNQRITQARRHRRAAANFCAKLLKFRLLPGEGQSNPKTQTSRGGASSSPPQA
jgi:hypothetical protein